LAIVEPVLEQEHFELVDIEYRREKSGWVLRLYVDREGGVTVDDCAEISGRVSDVLEVKDIIPHAYNLEVSSPGLDRPLTKEKDFIKALNKKITVKTFEPIEGRKNFKGVLRSFDGDRITLDCQDTNINIPLHQVSRARLYIEF
jgi:ribosome maturation factor RimP